jgi:cob(I)alamin adenosyltransferase
MGQDPSTPPTDPPRRAPRAERPSLVLVNTGDGKGKSTAAFGTALRAVAAGWPVAVVQFLKSDDWRVGEEQACRRLGVDWWALGDGFTWDSDDLDRTEAVACEAWRAASELLGAGTHRLVVLDELTYPVNWGWLDAGEVAGAIRDREPQTNVIVTGRDAPESLLAVADTVTEMRKVRHAFDDGVMARRGLDY